jgi:chaperone BCS1
MINKTRIEKIQKGITLATTVYAHGKNLHNWYQSRDRYIATVEEDAYGYGELMKWLNERITGKRYRFLVDRYGVDRYLDAKETLPIEIDGHKLTVSVGGGADEAGDLMGMMNGPAAIRREVLTFTSQGVEGIIALERLLEEMRQKEKNGDKQKYLYSINTFGWDGNTLPKRSIDSVFLPEGEKDALIADIQNFLASSHDYDAVGIPWHRGYMLHGEPGNGKTSLTLALANELNMSLFTLNLSGVTGDRALASHINSVNDNSILLIEDIDIFSDSVSREAKKDSPTLAGMLNALDGVSTPRGLITFITTNHAESLDPALVRPGRIDYKLELKAPDAYQIRSMYRHVFKQELDVEPRKFESMADLTNVFKMNLGDPEAVRLEIKS